MPKSKVDNVDEPSADDEHLPGKNRNSFLVFQSEYRAKLKDQHPDMSHSDMQAKISAKWKELDEEKKQKYEIAAAKEFVQYVRKMAEQKDNHPELFDRSLAKPGKASGKRRGPGMTGYLLYVKERMTPAKTENPEAKQTDLTKIIAAEWKALDQTRKDKYNDKAKKMKADAEAEAEGDDGETKEVTTDKKRKSPDDNADAASSKAKKAKTEEAKPPAVVASKKDKVQTPKKEEKKEKKPAAPVAVKDDDSSQGSTRGAKRRGNK